jgi:hypothetical protein
MASPDILNVPYLDKLSAASWEKFSVEFEAYTRRGGKKSVKDLMSALVLKMICLRDPSAEKLEDDAFMLLV